MVHESWHTTFKNTPLMNSPPAGHQSGRPGRIPPARPSGHRAAGAQLNAHWLAADAATNQRGRRAGPRPAHTPRSIIVIGRRPVICIRWTRLITLRCVCRASLGVMLPFGGDGRPDARAAGRVGGCNDSRRCRDRRHPTSHTAQLTHSQPTDGPCRHVIVTVLTSF